MKKPGLCYSILIICLSFGVVMVPSLLWKVKTQPLFLLSWVITSSMCIRLGYSFKDIQQGMIEYCQKSLQPIIFMLCVGAMTGIWNMCGTVPEITKIGLDLIRSEYFLPTAFLLCMIFALISGSAFGTCGTIGTALIGIAIGLKLDLEQCAGAIVTGTYFGYMISPISDSENLLCGLMGRDIVTDIKHQAKIIIPSAVICFFIYYFMGFAINKHTLQSSNSIMEISAAISQTFKPGVINLLPLVVVIVMILFVKTTLMSILAGIVSGIVVSCLYQKNSIISTIEAMWSGSSISGENSFINEVFSRGGIKSMSDIVILFILAFGLVGILNKCGIVDCVISLLGKRIKGRLSATFFTVLTSFFVNVMSASSISSIVMTIGMLMPIYEKGRLDMGDLSRSVAVGSIICTLVIPWHSNAINSAGFLGLDSMIIISVMFAPIVAVLSLIVIQGFSLDKKFK